MGPCGIPGTLQSLNLTASQEFRGACVRACYCFPTSLATRQFEIPMPEIPMRRRAGYDARADSSRSHLTWRRCGVE